MRKLFILCMLVTLSICIFCGCSANSGKGNPAGPSTAPSESIKETTIADQTENTSSGETSKKLVVYFLCLKRQTLIICRGRKNSALW